MTRRIELEMTVSRNNVGDGDELRVLSIYSALPLLSSA